MIIDALFAPVLAAITAVVNLLPTGTAFEVGPVEAVWSAVRQVDSLVPVMGPLMAMLALLTAAVGFIALRLVLTLWNLIYP